MPSLVPESIESIPHHHLEQLTDIVDARNAALNEITLRSLNPTTSEYGSQLHGVRNEVYEVLWDTRNKTDSQLKHTMLLFESLASGAEVDVLHRATEATVHNGVHTIEQRAGASRYALRSAFDWTVLRAAENESTHNGVHTIQQYGSAEGRLALRGAFDTMVFQSAEQSTVHNGVHAIQQYASLSAALRRGFDKCVLSAAEIETIHNGVHTIQQYASNNSARQELRRYFDKRVMQSALNLGTLQTGAHSIDVYASGVDARSDMRADFNVRVRAEAVHTNSPNNALGHIDLFGFGEGFKTQAGHELAEKWIPIVETALKRAQDSQELIKTDVDMFDALGFFKRMFKVRSRSTLRAQLRAANSKVDAQADLLTVLEDRLLID